MHRRGRPRAASLILLIPAALGIWATNSAAQQGDGVPWGQFQGGPAHGGFLPDGPQPPYRVRWTMPAPAGGGLSSPIVIGDEVVSVGSQAVYGIDLATGQVTWQIPRVGGPVSTPAAASVGGRDLLVYLEGPAATDPASPSPAASPSEIDLPVDHGRTVADGLGVARWGGRGRGPRLLRRCRRPGGPLGAVAGTARGHLPQWRHDRWRDRLRRGPRRRRLRRRSRRRVLRVGLAGRESGSGRPPGRGGRWGGLRRPPRPGHGALDADGVRRDDGGAPLARGSGGRRADRRLGPCTDRRDGDRRLDRPGRPGRRRRRR